MKSVTILGATGSVGSSTLDLIERDPDAFEILALTANCDTEKLAAAAIRTNARRAVVADEACLPDLRERLAGSGIEAAGGPRRCWRRRRWAPTGRWARSSAARGWNR